MSGKTTKKVDNLGSKQAHFAKAAGVAQMIILKFK